MIYLLIVLLNVFLIYNYDIKGRNVNKDLWYSRLLFIFIALAGFRYRIGSDTVGYLYDYYHDNPSIQELVNNFSFDSEILFRGILSLFHSWGFKFYIFQIVHAVFVNVLLFKYFKKHSQYWFTCAFFYFIWMYSFYNTEELRATISVVLYLYAFEYFFKNKWIKGYLLILIGCFFHRSSYFLLVTPLFIFLKFDWKGCASIIAAFIGGAVIKVTMGDYLDLLAISEDAAGRMESYMQTRYWEQNNNIYSLLVQIVPFILYPISSYLYTKRRNYDSQLAQLEPLFVMGLMCVAAQANVELFYRFVHFYAIIFIIYFSNLAITIVKCNKKKMGLASIVLSLVVFIPLFVAIGRQKADIWSRYYPYSSVFERSIDRQRELDYSYDLDRKSVV